jgi:glycosyltransferase involved in cell wall biosynthesis
MAARPQAQVCIVGGDQVAYGSSPPNADSWKSVMLSELSDQLDMTRVHFLDRVPYDDLTALLRVSRVHVYLTYPFVLSWSLLEAMALGCLVVASDVGPVQEVIADGQNGFLVPFFDAEALAQKTANLLAKPGQFDAVKRRASAGIHANYHFEKNILPQFHELLAELVPDVAQVA